MNGFKLSADKKTLLGYEGNCPEEIVIPDGVEIIEKKPLKVKKHSRKLFGLLPSLLFLKKSSLDAQPLKKLSFLKVLQKYQRKHLEIAHL